MKIEKFIEKALKGGWTLRGSGIDVIRITMELGSVRFTWKGDQYSENGEEQTVVDIEVILLDPRSWQAVGKVDEYPAQQCLMCGGCNKHVREDCRMIMRTGWEFQMHLLVDALCQASNKPNFNLNKAIEEYLKTL